MDKREAFVRFYIIKNLICNIEIEKKKKTKTKTKKKTERKRQHPSRSRNLCAEETHTKIE